MTEDAALPLHPPHLDDRYRFDRMIGATAAATVWLGWDERLLRPVRLHVLTDPSRLQGALATARIHHPALLATVDVCHDPPVMVTEHLLGRPLTDHPDPWRWEDTAQVVDPVGEAVAVLHESGLAHGSLSPGSVELGPDGRVVVIDCVALPDPDGELARTDVAALNGILTAMVTGVDGDPVEMLEALEHLQPQPPDELVSLVRAGLDPHGGGPVDAADWTRRLRAMPAWQPRSTADPADAGPVDFVRSERAWFIPALLVVTVGLVLAVVGFTGGGTPVGRRIIDQAREAVGLQETPTTRSTVPSTTEVDSPATAPGDGVPIAAIVDFDPGGDFDEHADRLRLINDADADEGWYTENYTTRDFGGLKEGVGLIVRLQEPVELSRVRVESPNVGWSAEIHTSIGGLPDDLEAWGPATGVVSGVDGAATIDAGGQQASAFLVWITDLGEATSEGHRFTVTGIEAIADR